MTATIYTNLLKEEILKGLLISLYAKEGVDNSKHVFKHMGRSKAL